MTVDEIATEVANKVNSIVEPKWQDVYDAVIDTLGGGSTMIDYLPED